MEQCFTDLGLLWEVTKLVNSTEQEMRQSEKLIEFNVRVLTEYINDMAKSISELLITFCGPIRLETPEGVKYNNTRDGGHCEDRYPQFTFYDTSEIIH